MKAEKKNTLVSMWAKKYTAREISMATGLSEGAIYSYARRNRDILPKRQGGSQPDEGDVARACMLRRCGVTGRDAAKVLNVSVATVGRYVRRDTGTKGPIVLEDELRRLVANPSEEAIAACAAEIRYWYVPKEPTHEGGSNS